MRRRFLPLLIAGTILVPAIGASAQLPPLTTTTEATTTTTTTEETTTTTEATTTTTEATTTTTEATTTTTVPAQQGGSLSISAPAASTLSSGPTGSGSLSAQLGAVTVTDGRDAINSSWTATVAASSFTTGDATAAETIARSNVSYWSGPATATSGIGALTPGQLTAIDSAELSVPRTAFSGAGAVGNTEVTWNPTVDVTIPASAVAGSYTGSITHSVA